MKAEKLSIPRRRIVGQLPFRSLANRSVTDLRTICRMSWSCHLDGYATTSFPFFFLHRSFSTSVQTNVSRSSRGLSTIDDRSMDNRSFEFIRVARCVTRGSIDRTFAPTHGPYPARREKSPRVALSLHYHR